jgi:hypothetical protein
MKSARAKIIAASISFPMCCPTVVCGMPSLAAVRHAISYAKFYSRSQDAVIRVYDEAGNVIETHEHNGDFKEW